MVYDFDKVIDRLPTSSMKWSYRKQNTGVGDVLPLWVADMDFASPPEVVRAIKKRAAHPIYGYTRARMFGSGGSMFMRVNIGCPRSTLITALERLEKAVKEL